MKKYYRVIEQLRREFPGKWIYIPRQNRWIHENGWYVEPRMSITPLYEGDDNNFTKIYCRFDTNEEVSILVVGEQFKWVQFPLASSQ